MRERFPQADLIIAGKGPEEAALRAQCRSLGLESAVQFPGYVDRPYLFYPGASLFVLSSRQEGLPNALLEAIAAGLPIVALPASDLLRGRPGAWLAPQISATALATEFFGALDTLDPGQRFFVPSSSAASLDSATAA